MFSRGEGMEKYHKKFIVFVTALALNCTAVAATISGTCGSVELAPGQTFAILPLCATGGQPPGLAQGGGEVDEDSTHSFHFHRPIVYLNNSGTQSFENQISTDPPFGNYPTARIQVFLRGIVNFLGDPDLPASVSASITGEYHNGTATVSADCVRPVGQSRTCQFNSASEIVDTGGVGGSHISTLRVTITGGGQYVSLATDESDVTPIPEPSTILMLGPVLASVLVCAVVRRFNQQHP